MTDVAATEATLRLLSEAAEKPIEGTLATAEITSYVLELGHKCWRR